jgi:flagellar motor switch protein FliG
LQNQDTTPFIKTDKEPESKYRRVAKFLILMGGDEAARIFAKLDRAQVEAISKEITTIHGISEEEAKALFEEFSSLLSLSGGYTGAFSGGVEEARRLLYAAFGPEKGEAMLRKTVPEAAGKPFAFLEDFSAEQLTLLFKEESPAAEALVLSRLPPKLAAEVINTAEPKRKLEIIRRIARMDRVAPSVLEQVAAALKEKARKTGKTDTEAIDGMGALAAIIRSSGFSFETRLLNELSTEAPDLSYDLRSRLYTLDDVVRASDIVLEEKLRSMSERDIVFLLKGRKQAFIQKILMNVSAPRRALIREEADILGPVSRMEADMVASDFLTWFRRGRETGTIVLSDDEDLVF